MKNFWQRYWKWSDKINAPFKEHKDRLSLYVVLAQTVIVSVVLFQLTSKDKMEMTCFPDLVRGTLECVEK